MTEHRIASADPCVGDGEHHFTREVRRHPIRLVRLVRYLQDRIVCTRCDGVLHDWASYRRQRHYLPEPGTP